MRWVLEAGAEGNACSLGVARPVGTADGEQGNLRSALLDGGRRPAQAGDIEEWMLHKR